MTKYRASDVVGIVVAILLISSGGFLLISFQSNLFPGNGNTTTITEPNDGFVKIEELVASTFKDIGFGPAPGENSTIESTAEALELLSEFNLIDAPLLEPAIDATYEYTMARRAGDGGFHPVIDTWMTDSKTTALSVRILRLMNRLDEDTILDVKRYLDTWYSLENWFDEPFEGKYWNLRCAHELDVPNNLRQIGLYELTLENIYDPGEDPGMDTGRPILWSDQIFFEYGFNEEPLLRRLQILECFEYMVPNPLHRPIIFGLLVNESDTVEQLLSLYDNESGLMNRSMDFTWMTYRTLTNTGNLSQLLYTPDDNSVSRLIQMQERISSVVDMETARANPNATISEVLLLVRIANILEYNLNHGFIEDMMTVFWKNSQTFVSDIETTESRKRSGVAISFMLGRPY